MSDTINRYTSTALVERMRQRNSLITKSEAELAVSRVFDAVKSLADEDGPVRVANFGTFKKKFKPERQGRNPATGEAIRIAAKNVLSFTPAKGA